MKKRNSNLKDWAVAVIVYIIPAVILLAGFIAYVSGVVSSDAPWWLKLFFLKRG